MNRLEEIKNEYAKSYGSVDWNDYVDGMSAKDRELELNEICIIYATECVKTSLEKASENATTQMLSFGYNNYVVNEESITNESNIVLL